MKSRSQGIPSAPFQDLEKGRISPDEYAQRVRREVREVVREAPPPKEPKRSGDDGSQQRQ